jgi:hypothetical protein
MTLPEYLPLGNELAENRLPVMSTGLTDLLQIRLNKMEHFDATNLPRWIG